MTVQKPSVNDDWPSHAEELTRKSMEVAERVLWQLDQGEISEREAWLVLGCVYDTVSGLVHKDVMDALTATREAQRPKPVTARRSFAKIKDGKLQLMVLEVSLGDSEVITRAGVFGKELERRVLPAETPKAAKTTFAQLAKGLVEKKGYREII